MKQYCRNKFALLCKSHETLVFFFLFLGTSGRALPVVTNYFKLEMTPDWHLYQYDVKFNPPIDSRKMRMALLMTHENLLGRTKAFDGMILYLPHRLQEQARTMQISDVN